MKAIGKYKDHDINITDMYICETYGTHLLLSKHVVEQANQDILSEEVSRKVARMFGDHHPVYVAGLKRINLKEFLPGVMVYACLQAWAIKEGEFDGSHLILVWLQDSAEGFYEQAKAHLRQIVWEEKARDFEF